MNLSIIVPPIVGAILTLLLMPFWIKKAHRIGLVWKDMNKHKDVQVAGSGGIIVLMSFLIATLSYVAFMTFYNKDGSNLVQTFAILLTVLFVGILGFVDDLFGWQSGGLSRRSRILLVLVAAVPLMAIKAGESIINLPLVGQIQLGWIYPLVFIPIGIVGATTTFNFLAGFNGLEAGQGILLLGGAAIVSYFIGETWVTVLLACMIAVLLAFMFFNFYPTSVFPGDVLTYPVGALLAAASIVGNFEKIAVFFFIPCVIEFILKARGRFVKSSFGMPEKDGSLRPRYSAIYGLTHTSIFVLNKLGIRATEKRVVYLIWGFQAAIIIVGLLIFREGIFNVQVQ